MPFNGAGVFNRLYSWVNDAANGIKIRADRMDNEMNGMATGLTTCVTRDGQSPATANLPMGGFKHTNVADATTGTDYAAAKQVTSGMDGGTVGGTATVITLVSTVPLTALQSGQWVSFIAISNSGAGATLNRDGLGAKPLLQGLNPIVAGHWLTGDLIVARYDGTQYNLILPMRLLGIGLSPIAGSSISTSGDISSNGTIQAGFMVAAPAGTGYFEARSFGVSYFYTDQIRSTASIRVISNASGGVQLLNGATSWTAISSRLYKKNIEPISDGAVARIGKMSKVLFRYKNDPDTQPLRPGTFYEDALESGLSYITAYAPAEKRICPQSEKVQEIPEVKGLSLELLVPDLMKAIDELAAEITQLKALIKS